MKILFLCKQYNLSNTILQEINVMEQIRKIVRSMLLPGVNLCYTFAVEYKAEAQQGKVDAHLMH
jgi:hypothetical protein